MKIIATNYMTEVVSDLLAPHTSGPRDVPRCGALSLLQKPLHYRGNPAETAATLNVKLCVPVVVVVVVVVLEPGCGLPHI